MAGSFEPSAEGCKLSAGSRELEAERTAMDVLTARRWILGFVLSVLAIVPAPSAQRAAPVVAADIPRIAFEKYTLPNGLDVILSEDKRLPMVAVNVWYHVGP